MTALLALIGALLLMSMIVPTVAVMQRVVERSPALGLLITTTGVALALFVVNLYTKVVR